MPLRTKIIALVCLTVVIVLALSLWEAGRESVRSEHESQGLTGDIGATGNTLAAGAMRKPLVDESNNDADQGVLSMANSRPGPVQATHIAIYDWLRKASPDDSGQRGHVLKNQVMDELCARRPLPEGLGDLLAEVYRDRSQNVVIRDYALQHLVEFYAQRAKELDGIPAELQGDLLRAREVLWEAVAEADTSIAGTALLGLRRLSEGASEFNREEIATTALQLAQNARTGELTRITALQIAASMGSEQILPTAMRLAQDGKTMSLRISAVAALGAAKNAEAVPLLMELAQGTEPRLRLPAERALASINSK